MQTGLTRKRAWTIAIKSIRMLSRNMFCVSSIQCHVDVVPRVNVSLFLLCVILLIVPSFIFTTYLVSTGIVM